MHAELQASGDKSESKKREKEMESIKEKLKKEIFQWRRSS